MQPRFAQLRIAPDPRHLAIARSFLAATLRLQGTPEDRIDDLRIALSELLTTLISQGRDAIEVEVSTTPPVRVTVTANEAMPLIDEETLTLVTLLTEGRFEAAAARWSIEVPVA